MNQRMGRRKQSITNQESNATANGAVNSDQKPTVENRVKRAEIYALVSAITASVAAIAALVAAGFSGWQASIASDTEERQLRPYMSISIKESDASVTEDGGTVGIRPQMKAFGSTPAGGVNPMWELHVADYPMKYDKFVYSYINKETVTTMVLAPGEPEGMEKKTIQLSKDDVAAIRTGTKRIYIDGTVMYYDSFSKVRWSNFCFTTNFDMLKENSFDTCPTHNTADWNRIPQSSYRPYAQVPM